MCARCRRVSHPGECINIQENQARTLHHVSTSERCIYRGKSEKRKARIGPRLYTNRVASNPLPAPSRKPSNPRAVARPRKHGCRGDGKKLKAHDIMTTLTKEQNGYELPTLPPSPPLPIPYLPLFSNYSPTAPSLTPVEYL